MYRPYDKLDTGVICLTCGTIVVDRKAHSKRHEKKQTPKYRRITVSDLKQMLEGLNDELEITLEVSGYEWDYAALCVLLTENKQFTLMEI